MQKPAGGEQFPSRHLPTICQTLPAPESLPARGGDLLSAAPFVSMSQLGPGGGLCRPSRRFRCNDYRRRWRPR